MEQKGFFGSLFDFSFTTFVTSKIIKFLYGLSIVGVALVSLVLIIGSFTASTATGVVMLFIGAPFFFLISVIYARVTLEMIIVIFRISEHVAELAEQRREGSSHPPSKPEVVICPKCGAENPPGAKFCQNCGAKLQPEPVICPKCGAENEPGAKFCSQCGARLSSEDS